jgi:hypothetical protein
MATKRRRRVATTAVQEGLNCSFCGKSHHQVLKMIAGPGVYVCNECVDLCNQIIAEELDLKDVQAATASAGATCEEPRTLRRRDHLSDDQLLADMVRAHAGHEGVDRAVAERVAELRARGVSWARIGDALGMTRQSAWERFSGED